IGGMCRAGRWGSTCRDDSRSGPTGADLEYEFEARGALERETRFELATSTLGRNLSVFVFKIGLQAVRSSLFGVLDGTKVPGSCRSHVSEHRLGASRTSTLGRPRPAGRCCPARD